MRPYPNVFEANARLFLRRLAAHEGRPVTLASVPTSAWERLAAMGFDVVWLMGVWERSQSARAVALQHPALRQEYGNALPDWTEADVAGSPYAVRAYNVDSALGGDDDLKAVREQLHERNMGLMVDFVPNHLALDHPWTATHPARFVQATAEQAAAHPTWFYDGPQGAKLAHGRDPYFGPWTDTVQVDFFAEDLRVALIGELLQIAETADGVRCDMAMLGLNDVFQWLWGDFTPHARPVEEFWAEAISTVKGRHPGFVFLAEAYWGHEPELQRLGFDYTYDKTLYDRLRWDDAEAIRAHLAGQAAPPSWGRFIENHDEGRTAALFGPERARAAAAVIATLPGLRLWYDGQLTGRQARLPVQLIREPTEPPDRDAEAFYERLLRAVSGGLFHRGAWELAEFHEDQAAPGAHRGVLAWHWRHGADIALVAVNYAPAAASGYLNALGGHRGWRDALTDGPLLTAMKAGTLRLALAPWQAIILVPLNECGC
ncbi:MAG: alpha-amylase family glycosyl hydrolase [Dehalococcoidia bacterium]